MQEATGAGLLHHLVPDEAGQLTEAVGAVDDGVTVAILGASQQEVAVCRGGRTKTVRSGFKGNQGKAASAQGTDGWRCSHESAGQSRNLGLPPGRST